MNKASKYTIKLLKIEHLVKEYYSFDFSKPDGFSFTEGQYGIFGFINKEVEGKPLRAFSISSSNEEPFIRIATRILDVPSDFKHKLLNLKVGEELTMSAPLGDFTLDEAFDAVFIAGGIGITPIRSMLFSNSRKNGKRHDTLIYSELEANYPFKKELEPLSRVETLYAADIEPTQAVIKRTCSKFKNNVFYYLSGSPGFVKGISALLEEQSVSKDKIKFDVFIGY